MTTPPEPTAPADTSTAETDRWYTALDLDGQPYPVRHDAGCDIAYLDVTEAQLNYLRAVHEAGHAVAVLLGGGHLHSAEIVIGDTDAETGGVVYACNLADGHGYAIYSAAGERAADRWLREAGLWTPQHAVANEVAARSDRQQFLAINPHVGFGDRQIDYRMVHDLADAALDQRWAAVLRVTDQLVQHQRIDGEAIADLAGLPNGRGSAKCPLQPATVPPLVEPRQHGWDETPAEAADCDRRYWLDRDED